jgi:hypothetical protein
VPTSQEEGGSCIRTPSSIPPPQTPVDVGRELSDQAVIGKTAWDKLRLSTDGLDQPFSPIGRYPIWVNMPK